MNATISEMLNLQSAALAFGLCLLLYTITKVIVRKLKFKKLPPGPSGYPLVGCLQPVSHVSLFEHADLYGDVSYFHALGTDIVIFNTVEAVREGFQSPKTAEVFSARYSSFFKYVMYDDIVMRSSYEPHWKQQRQVLHTALRAYGEGISEIEHVVNQELEYVKHLVNQHIDQDFDLYDYFGFSVLNIIYTLLNGERYDYNDVKIQNVVEANEVANGLANPMIDTILRVFPFLKYLPFGLGKKCRFIEKSSKLFLEVAFEQCRRKPILDREHLKGVSYELLRQQKSSNWLSTDLVRGCVQDIGGAGNLTTRNSLYTFFLIILHYPEVQKRIQDEIDACVVTDRNINVSDRKNMPYTVACILELTRYASNVALSVPHTSAKDTEFFGYTIPSGSVIIPNLFRIHHDEKLWKDPWVFDPTRFLDDNGYIVPASHPIRQNLIAFGVGKRMCMGETFAKTRIFLYITSLLQSFTFIPCGKIPSCDPRTYDADIVIHPPHYRVKAIPRSE